MYDHKSYMKKLTSRDEGFSLDALDAQQFNSHILIRDQLKTRWHITHAHKHMAIHSASCQPARVSSRKWQYGDTWPSEWVARRCATKTNAKAARQSDSFPRNIYERTYVKYSPYPQSRFFSNWYNAASRSLARRHPAILFAYCSTLLILGTAGEMIAFKPKAQSAKYTRMQRDKYIKSVADRWFIFPIFYRFDFPFRVNRARYRRWYDPES